MRVFRNSLESCVLLKVLVACCHSLSSMHERLHKEATLKLSVAINIELEKEKGLYGSMFVQQQKCTNLAIKIQALIL